MAKTFIKIKKEKFNLNKSNCKKALTENKETIALDLKKQIIKRKEILIVKIKIHKAFYAFLFWIKFVLEIFRLSAKHCFKLEWTITIAQS